MLDLGFLTLWTNTALSFLTVVYHTVILVTHRRGRRTDEPQPPTRLYPTSTTASLVCVYLLAFFWIAPFGLLVCQFVFMYWPVWNIAVQFALGVIELGLLVALAVISTKMRRSFQPADKYVFKSTT